MARDKDTDPKHGRGLFKRAAKADTAAKRPDATPRQATARGQDVSAGRGSDRTGELERLRSSGRLRGREDTASELTRCLLSKHRVSTRKGWPSGHPFHS